MSLALVANKKIFNRKIFIFLTTLSSGVNIYLNFFFKFTLRCVWTCSHYLPQESLTPVANLPPVLTTLAILVANLPLVSWYRWCTLTCKYLREISKNGEDDSRKKNQKQKISWHCPFNKLRQYWDIAEGPACKSHCSDLMAGCSCPVKVAPSLHSFRFRQKSFLK